MKGCKAQQTSLLDILHINHFNIKHLPAHMKEHYLLYIIISLLHSEASFKGNDFYNFESDCKMKLYIP